MLGFIIEMILNDKVKMNHPKPDFLIGNIVLNKNNRSCQSDEL
jgi:hypothetical protein